MKNLLKTILAMAAVICVGSAYAVGTLTLFDGTNTITITDGGVGDANPAPGAVTFVGSIGIWTLNVDTGLTKPAVGSVSSPQMDLSFLAVSSGTGGTLSITFSDNGFSASGVGTDSIGGTTQGTVFDQILVNGITALTLGPFVGPKFTGSTSGFFVLGPGDTLSLEVDITHGAGSLLSSGDKNFNMVPDGGSAVALLGIALAGIEGVRRMVRARKA